MRIDLRIDPHRHLGGSIPSGFVWDTIRANNLSHLASSYNDVVAAMCFTENEETGFHRFLRKFDILDRLPWSEELVDGSIKAASAWLAAERIDYAWMRFSINKYVERMRWSKADAISFISDAFERHRPGGVGLILSLKYESDKDIQRSYASVIDNENIVDRLIGIDLVGDEAHYDCTFYGPIFKEWGRANKILCAHVGESQTAINVRTAIEHLKIRHVAHGIRVVADQYTIDMAKDLGICFDLALTSNFLTGVCPRGLMHPIRYMVDAGLKVTIGTDDPVVCDTTLDREYALLDKLGFSAAEIAAIRTTATANTVGYRLTGFAA